MQYHKIENIYKRDPQTHKLIEGEFQNPSVDLLQNNKWLFKEKLDGMNVRIIWDGHQVEFRGRTDKARVPEEMLAWLEKYFIEELFEQEFGEKEVVFFGEGIGGKIQKGARYSDYQCDEKFILFDIVIGYMFLQQETVEELAEKFNVEVAKDFGTGKLLEGVQMIKKNIKSLYTDKEVEGIIAIPIGDFRSRNGQRIITKIKHKDFRKE